MKIANNNTEKIDTVDEISLLSCTQAEKNVIHTHFQLVAAMFDLPLIQTSDTIQFAQVS